MNDREMIREIQKGKKEYLNDIAEKYSAVIRQEIARMPGI